MFFIKHLIDGKPTIIIKMVLDPEACRSKVLRLQM